MVDTSEFPLSTSNGNSQDSVAPGDGQLLAPDVVERFQ